MRGMRSIRGGGTAMLISKNMPGMSGMHGMQSMRGIRNMSGPWA